MHYNTPIRNQLLNIEKNHCGLNLPTWMKRNAHGMEWNCFDISFVFSRSNAYRSIVTLVNFLRNIVLWTLTTQTGTQTVKSVEDMLFHHVLSITNNQYKPSNLQGNEKNTEKITFS